MSGVIVNQWKSINILCPKIENQNTLDKIPELAQDLCWD